MILGGLRSFSAGLYVNKEHARIRGAGLQPAYQKQPKGLRPKAVGFILYTFLGFAR